VAASNGSQSAAVEVELDLGIAGKTAVVTGASVGIGLAVCEALAREGANVVMAARTADRLEREAARIDGLGAGRAIGVACDVATAEGTGALVEAVTREFGGADILINNAGTGSNETVLEADDQKWYAYWDLHVMASVRLARGLVPGMTERGGGVILNNASICATQPLWYEPIYNVTKAALVMLGKCMATEFIAKNIRVNTISPGLVLTPDWVKTAKQLTQSSGGDYQAYLDGVANEHAAIKRFASAEEIADFMVFLCSERATYSVGSNYFVDGGMLKTL
jgi:NAD(P)-dependent dehydrogenase (short-subunit alcohol dehydrogenase family)